MLSTGKTVAVYLGLALVFAFAILSGSSIDFVLGKYFIYKFFVENVKPLHFSVMLITI